MRNANRVRWVKPSSAVMIRSAYLSAGIWPFAGSSSQISLDALQGFRELAKFFLKCGRALVNVHGRFRRFGGTRVF